MMRASLRGHLPRNHKQLKLWTLKQGLKMRSKQKLRSNKGNDLRPMLSEES